MTELTTDLSLIKNAAIENESENDCFQTFLKGKPVSETDAIVYQLNATISGQIDCTQCGNCCRSLMINITTGEIEALALTLEMSVNQVREKYIEESQQGVMIMNTIPCHFLSDNRCSIYKDRFTECRDFPHLHKPNFKARMFSTMMYYSMCPIIFNVVENLKVNLGFKIVQG